MQMWSEQNAGRAQTSTRKFIMTVILLFSLAGLIVGFTVGGLTASRVHPTTNDTGPAKKSTPIVQRTAAVTPSPTPENIQLSPPTVTTYTSSEKADGTSSYTFSAQATDKVTGKAITVADVTCRLWLTQDTNATDTALKANNYALLHTTDTFTQPFPQEVPNALNFTAPSTQVQNCATGGPTTWTYTLAPTVQPGTYFLYVLADWKGKHFNWSIRQLQVAA